MLFDLTALDANYFYAVAGITGTAFNSASSNTNRNNTVTFFVYGSTEAPTDAADAAFVLLAQSDVLKNYASGEFNASISGYKTLKLTTLANVKQAGTNSAWANACVYKLPCTEHTWDEGEITTAGHGYTTYVADEDGINETAQCDNGCGSTDTRKAPMQYWTAEKLAGKCSHPKEGGRTPGQDLDPERRHRIS